MRELDLYSYLIGNTVAMSYLIVPRLEKIIDKIIKQIKKWRKKQNV